MQLSDRTRVLLSLPLLAFFCLVPAAIVGFPLDAAIYFIRDVSCSADTFLVVKPFLGDETYNVLVVVALGLFFLTRLLGWMISIFPEYYGDLTFTTRTIRVAQGVALCYLVAVLSVYNHAQQTCIKDAGVEFRPTLGSAILYPWHALAGTSVDCVMGAGKSDRWDFWLHMTDGRRIEIELRDIMGARATQAVFWQHVYDNHVPVTFDAFHTDDPGCWQDFPGLRKPV